MKLLKARISSFRSVADTNLFVDRKVTILVGPNEGGKTNVLRALESFSPDKAFVETAVCQFSPAYEHGHSPEIQLLFGDFSTNDVEMLTQVLEAEEDRLRGLQRSEERGEDEAIAANLGRAVPVDTPVAELSEPQELPHTFVPVAPRSPRFTRMTVTRQGNDIRDFVVHFDDDEVFVTDSNDERAVKSKFLESLPRFLYFEDVNLLRGEIQLDQLLSDDPAYEAERNLLRLGGIADLETLAGHPHRRDVALKNAEQRVTARLRKYWTQDPSREFHIDIDKETVRIRISDATGVFDFPENRSLGSRWFISFYINFASRIEGEEENAILLFDEPGIHVHPRGLRDLLPFFEELAQKYQIIYTTHLPFLVNRNFPARIRVVEKSGSNGTQINNKPHQNRWQAIRSAVGLLAADSFIVGDTCLVVEGVSDHIYLSGLSPYLAQLEAPHLDMNEVAIIPAGSASETIPISRFCQAEKIPVVVLLDSDNQGDQAKARLLNDDFIEERQVMRVEDCCDDKVVGVIAIEDALPLNRMVSAANSAYKQLAKGFIALSDKEVSDARSALGSRVPVTRAFEKIFKDKGYGDFDKRLVAEYFINSLQSVESLSPDERKNQLGQFETIGNLFATARDRLGTLSKELK